jgi:serralysin
MASVSGSQLSFFSPNGRPVHLILSDDATAKTVPGAFNIEIFTTSGPGTPLHGVRATATIGGAVAISSNEVQAATLGSVEQLGTGKFTMLDQTGGEDIVLGRGAQTVLGSSGDTIAGGDAWKKVQEIDLIGASKGVIAGPMTALGGTGRLFVEAGAGDSIVGGSGRLTVSGGGPVHDSRSVDKDRRYEGRHGRGVDHDGTAVASNDTIVGGSGRMTVSGGTGDSITGGTGRLQVTGVTGSTIVTGTGGTTVRGGNNDVIADTVSGPLLVDIESRNKIHGHSPLVAGSGMETVNLGAGHGATTLTDLSVPGGRGERASTTVTGFSTTTDEIVSKTSVNPAGQFLGTSTTTALGTTLTFHDGTTMTLVGITDISQVTFAR